MILKLSEKSMPHKNTIHYVKRERNLYNVKELCVYKNQFTLFSTVLTPCILGFASYH